MTQTRDQMCVDFEIADNDPKKMDYPMPTREPSYSRQFFLWFKCFESMDSFFIHMYRTMLDNKFFSNSSASKQEQLS